MDKTKQLWPLFIFILVFGLSVETATAINTPPMPTAVKGKVMIDGETAPRGTLVSARYEGEKIGESKTSFQGNFVIDLPSRKEIEGEEIELWADGKWDKNIEYETGMVKEVSIDVESSMVQYGFGFITGKMSANPTYTAMFAVLGISVLILIGILHWKRR